MAKTHKRCCLIGIDDDEVSLSAFQFYVEHLHRQGNRLVLVHIVLPPVKSTNQLSLHLDASREVSITNEKLRVRGLQDKYEDLMRAYKIQGGINVIYYSLSPGKILCEVAEEEKCSLIIIGSRCNSSYSPDSPSEYPDEDGIHVGEIGEHILKKSPCPVLVVRPYEFKARNERIFQDSFVQDSEPSPRRRSLVVPGDQRIRKTSWPPPNPHALSHGHASFSGSEKNGFLNVAKTEEKRRHSAVTNPFPALQSKLNDVKRFFGGSNNNSRENVGDEDDTET